MKTFNFKSFNLKGTFNRYISLSRTYHTTQELGHYHYLVFALSLILLFFVL